METFKNVAVIGDVHGCVKTLIALVNKIKEKYPNDEIALVADLIDRGPSSKEVVQYVIDNSFKCVKGNHEDLCVKDMLSENPAEVMYHGEWLVYQAGATLASYQKDGKLDKEGLIEHARWMEKLPYYIEFKDVEKDGRYLVVSHASIGSTWKFRDPNHEKHHFFKDEVIWNRGAPDDVKEIYNIYGHTPQSDGPKIKSFFANVDTGACLKRDFSEQYGVMTALRFPSMEIIQQKNIDW